MTLKISDIAVSKSIIDVNPGESTQVYGGQTAAQAAALAAANRAAQAASNLSLNFSLGFTSTEINTSTQSSTIVNGGNNTQAQGDAEINFV